jgi:uncharacterized Zn finger protein
MVSKDIPETIFCECPDCDDFTEHRILNGRMGKDNITGTFQCTECKRTFTDTIRIPRQLEIKVMFSDGDQTEVTQTQLQSDDVVSVGDEFYLDDGRRVRVTFIEIEGGERPKRCQAGGIRGLWVKKYDVLSVKVSVNDNHKTYPFRVEAEPDDEFAVGMTLTFPDYDCIIHAIKTTDGLLKRGSAEAREITRIYGKARRKTYDVLDFGDDKEEFNEADYKIEGEAEDQ